MLSVCEPWVLQRPEDSTFIDSFDGFLHPSRVANPVSDKGSLACRRLLTKLLARNGKRLEKGVDFPAVC
jgi:hypothetical protein